MKTDFGQEEKERYARQTAFNGIGRAGQEKLAKSHVRNIVPWLEYQGLIRIMSGRKIKYIKITKKGEKEILDILKLKKDMKNGEL